MIRKSSLVSLVVLWSSLFCGAALAEDSAGSIPEEKLTTLAVQLPATTIEIGGTRLALAAGEYHYNLYLPKGYNDDPQRQFPVLFKMSSVGDAKMEGFEARLKRDKIIFIGLVEAKNGEWPPILANFIAAHDDAMKRFRIAEGFRFATGASGGARASSCFTYLRPGFAGLLFQAAGTGIAGLEAFTRTPTLCAFATFGYTDSNTNEAAQIAGGLPAYTPRRIITFNGGHTGAPEAEMNEAFDFMETWAYTRSPAVEKRKPMYVQRFKDLMELAAGAEGMKKYEFLEAAQAHAKARRLSEDKNLAGDVTIVSMTLKDLAKDEKIVKELAARKAYSDAREIEDTHWYTLVKPDASFRNFLRQAGKKYETIGTQFSGTLYGDKAAERGKWMTAIPDAK